VLADPLAPKVVAAVAAGVLGCVKIDPVFLGSTGEVVSALADPVSFEREAALEAADIYPACPLEINRWFHFSAPIPSDRVAEERAKSRAKVLTSSQIEKSYNVLLYPAQLTWFNTLPDNCPAPKAKPG